MGHEAVVTHAGKPSPGTRGKLHLAQLGHSRGEAVVHPIDIEKTGDTQLAFCLTLCFHHPGGFGQEQILQLLLLRQGATQRLLLHAL